MPKDTTIDPTQVESQAKMHEGKRDDISGQLKRVLSTLEDAKAHSNSAMTRALAEQGENWAKAVDFSVLQHMTEMVTNIRKAASDQSEADMAAVQKINNIPIGTANFLGA
ncbi:hypothetical protein [Amycolatopsis samaneae]|uniref:WXG100 family type VII secretion target n=1 Tax=Amycolatopsis samaneae TaxID=664691 RepID=A0ABW5GL96_9PSEU